MTPQERALQRLNIAIDQQDWRIAIDARNILDGTINHQDKPKAIPFIPRTAAEHARVS